MQKFFEGLTQEMAPGLEDIGSMLEELGPSLGGFLREMGPAMTAIAREVEDWSLYELPEIMPNGDIIIRRKSAPEQSPPDSNTDNPPGEIIDL